MKRFAIGMMMAWLIVACMAFYNQNVSAGFNALCVIYYIWISNFHRRELE